MSSFSYFLALPKELKLEVIKKLPASPFATCRRTCSFINDFCEKNRKFLKIYIYRKSPEILLFNSIKHTYPFYRQYPDDNEDISLTFVAVEYGYLYGQANFIMRMTEDNLDEIKLALSGFIFPEVSILNYAPDDPERNEDFSKAFELFLNIIKDNPPTTLNVKNLTEEQFDRMTTQCDVNHLRLRKAENNVQLVKKDISKKIRHFSVTFGSNYDLDFKTMSEVLCTKSIVTVDWGSYSHDKFTWSDLENLFTNYAFTFPDLFFYRLYLEENKEFYEADLLTKQSNIIPYNGFYLGSFGNRCIPNCPEATKSKNVKFDYWLLQLEGENRWRMTNVARQSWYFCTEVCVVLENMTSKEDLNEGLVAIIEDFVMNGPVTDYSKLFDELEEVEEIEEKRKIVIDFVNTLMEFYESE